MSLLLLLVALTSGKGQQTPDDTSESEEESQVNVTKRNVNKTLMHYIVHEQ